MKIPDVRASFILFLLFCAALGATGWLIFVSSDLKAAFWSSVCAMLAAELIGQIEKRLLAELSLKLLKLTRAEREEAFMRHLAEMERRERDA